MAFNRNGGSRTQEPQQREKNPPIFSRKVRTMSGTIEIAVFEKQAEGKSPNFFVTINRSYPDPKNDGQWIDTTVMNPQDLLIVSDLYKIAWDFILDECNRQ